MSPTCQVCRMHVKPIVNYVSTQHKDVEVQTK